MELPKIVQITSSEYGVVYALDEQGIMWKFVQLTSYPDKNGKRTGWEKVINYILEPK